MMAWSLLFARQGIAVYGIGDPGEGYFGWGDDFRVRGSTNPRPKIRTWGTRIGVMGESQYQPTSESSDVGNFI
jgi:hypothetical protein